MPNWCSNNITIQGPTETIRQLWEDAQTANHYTVVEDDVEVEKVGFGLLNAMVPIGDWEYGKAVETWSTKWDISDQGLEFKDNGDGTALITGWFDSAWAPPIGAYNKFLDDMDNCSIEASYYEQGMDFAGFYSDGVEDYLEGLYEESRLPEDEQSDLFKRIDEEWCVSEQYEEE